MKMSGKTAIVTGTGSGIGRSIAAELAQQGAAVLCCSRREENGKPAVEEILRTGGRARFFRCDVSREEEVRQAVQTALEFGGGVDILINNAGVNFSKPFEETTATDWNHVLGTDLTGTFYFCRHCIPPMLRQGSGSILNIVSNHSTGGYPNSAPYDAAKWGVVGLTKALGTEYAARGIRVNALSPGLIDTQIWADLKQAAPSPEQCEQYWYANIPARRVGRPEEIAKAAAFLVSDDAGYFVASNIIVDGGASSLLVSNPPFAYRDLTGR